jgi:hypothetical protein
VIAVNAMTASLTFLGKLIFEVSVQVMGSVDRAVPMT